MLSLSNLQDNPPLLRIVTLIFYIELMKLSCHLSYSHLVDACPLLPKIKRANQRASPHPLMIQLSSQLCRYSCICSFNPTVVCTVTLHWFKACIF